MQDRRRLSPGLHLIRLIIKGKHDSFLLFFSFYKLGHELYRAANNYQHCGRIKGGREGEGGIKSGELVETEAGLGKSVTIVQISKGEGE